jgi:hypothetical protein
VRSLIKTAKICIEGFMLQLDRKTGSWNRAWFVLEAQSDQLRGFPRRPMSDLDTEVVSIPLKDVSQVLKGGGSNAPQKTLTDLKRSAKMPMLSKESALSFRLCEASGQEEIAVFQCEDKSTLLWWLHGFQRRIFEQTKGILRKQKHAPKNASDVKKFQTLPHSLTSSGVQHRRMPMDSDWLTVTCGAVQG